MIEVLLSLLGIPSGYLLGLIAKEELETAKKYFTWIKRVLFILLSCIALYFIQSNFLLIITIISSTLLLIATFKTKKRLLEVLIYVEIITLGYILGGVVLTSLLFIYGLVVGLEIYNDKKRS